MKIKIGQLWWDEHKAWSDSACNFCYLVLSGNKPYPGETDDKSQNKWTYRLQEFQWNGQDGYFGTGQVREFEEDELRLMEYVGSIEDIKNFKKESKGASQ